MWSSEQMMRSFPRYRGPEVEDPEPDPDGWVDDIEPLLQTDVPENQVGMNELRNKLNKQIDLRKVQVRKKRSTELSTNEKNLKQFEDSVHDFHKKFEDFQRNHKTKECRDDKSWPSNTFVSVDDYVKNKTNTIKLLDDLRNTAFDVQDEITEAHENIESAIPKSRPSHKPVIHVTGQLRAEYRNEEEETGTSQLMEMKLPPPFQPPPSPPPPSPPPPSPPPLVTAAESNREIDHFEYDVELQENIIKYYGEAYERCKQFVKKYDQCKRDKNNYEKQKILENFMLNNSGVSEKCRNDLDELWTNYSEDLKNEFKTKKHEDARPNFQKMVANDADANYPYWYKTFLKHSLPGINANRKDELYPFYQTAQQQNQDKYKNLKTEFNELETKTRATIRTDKSEDVNKAKEEISEWESQAIRLQKHLQKTKKRFDEQNNKKKEL